MYLHALKQSPWPMAELGGSYVVCILQALEGDSNAAPLPVEGRATAVSCRDFCQDVVELGLAAP